MLPQRSTISVTRYAWPLICSILNDLQEYIFSFKYDTAGNVSMQLTANGKEFGTTASQVILLIICDSCLAKSINVLSLEAFSRLKEANWWII